MSIRGIAGRPYLALDNFVNVAEFDRLVPELWSGIDKAQLELGHYFPKSARPEDEEPEFQFLRIRREDDWNYKNFANHCAWTETAQYFPALKVFLETLPMAEIGRVKIFVNAPGQATKEHRDHNETYLRSYREVAHKNEFIWLNSAPERHLYLCNEARDRRVIAQERAIFFNEVDLHGCAAFPERNFSLRVDGRFNHEVRRAFALNEEPVY